MFLALAIEFKVGGLDIKSLEKRNRYAGFIGDGKEQPVPFRVAASKYPGIDLYDPVLSNDLVADVWERINRPKPHRIQLGRQHYVH